ncbi:peptidoglycan editing factor PgeF [Alicyclobacillus sp. SO9]|uniref:peptidoglycan editing factor PgeF n=1 Tax=Alicyclobacillus sp. SO9 TaxID=2665646 RepID=UPI0018E8A493|nr:peptidoglycan editing factor PgeF [Alicyclobacillus sp. SO9]QQE80716.1 peptidoglycan editing factor PgeF [Alicyclobacillus sp. SO9]
MLTAWTGNATGGTTWIRTNWPGDTARGLFSFRHGGVSEGPYASLNLGLSVHDNPHAVEQNRRIAAQQVGGDLEDWVLGQQVHGSHVAAVSLADKGKGIHHVHPPLPETDGLITNVPGITLAVLAADCVPVLFYDSERQVIGAAHSGWQGTVAHISVRVLEEMSRMYGTKPENVHVALGPSIRRCCYEVDERVAGKIRAAFGERYLVRRPLIPGKYLLGIQDCIRSDLEQHGVNAKSIVDAGVCTSCRVEHLYSHRKEHGSTGRSAGIVRLTPI